jgi:sulfofructose kinase
MKTDPRRVLCVGQATLDCVWTAARAPSADEKVRANDFRMQVGGIATNAAVTIAKLGVRPHLWARVGDDQAGSHIVHDLIYADVNTDWVQRQSDAISSVSSIIVNGAGERSITNFRGEGLYEAVAEFPSNAIADFEVVLADPRWPQGARTAFTRAREANIPTVLDAEVGDAKALRELLPLADYAIFSLEGLRALVSDAAAPYQDALRSLYDARHHACLAVTLGEHGVSWFDASGFHTLPAFAVRAIDTTGAGDVFHGAFAYAIASKMPLHESMRFASACAALKCRARGVQHAVPTAQEVHGFLNANPVNQTAKP